MVNIRRMAEERRALAVKKFQEELRMRHYNDNCLDSETCPDCGGELVRADLGIMVWAFGVNPKYRCLLCNKNQEYTTTFQSDLY